MSGEMMGRKVTISIGGDVVGIGRTKSLTINNESVNVTRDDDDGIQRLLDEPGEKAVEVSLDGMFDVGEDALIDLSLSSTPVAEIIFDYGTYTITGDFFMTSFSESMPYSDAITFSASFSSSGAVLKAPVPPPGG